MRVNEIFGLFKKTDPGLERVIQQDADKWFSFIRRQNIDSVEKSATLLHYWASMTYKNADPAALDAIKNMKSADDRTVRKLIAQALTTSLENYRKKQNQASAEPAQSTPATPAPAPAPAAAPVNVVTPPAGTVALLRMPNELSYFKYGNRWYQLFTQSSEEFNLTHPVMDKPSISALEKYAARAGIKTVAVRPDRKFDNRLPAAKVSKRKSMADRFGGRPK